MEESLSEVLNKYSIGCQHYITKVRNQKMVLKWNEMTRLEK